MSKEKQIKEMLIDISEIQNGGWEFVGGSEYTTDVDNARLVEHLYNAGYRKQSEGEWITEGNELKNTACSICGHWVETPYGKTPYCPNCGAKMK